MKTDLISIIIPVYNIEKFVTSCINSALSQTYRDIEIILVDDGSTDGSGKICDEYAIKDKRIKVIHKKNGGLVSARKAGVEVSEGEYIYHLDGDDYISKDAIEKLYKKAIETGVELVRVNFTSVDTSGNTIDRIATDFSTPEEWLCKILNGGIWSIWNNIIKRDVYVRSVSVPENITFGEDCITSLQLGLNVKNVSHIDSYTYFYTIRDTSIMNNMSADRQIKNHYSFLLMLEEMGQLADKYRNNKNKTVALTIEKAIADRIFLRLFSSAEALNKNRKRVFRLYWKYFLTKISVQKIIFKSSWKCWVYDWSCMLKFI